jgi:outer membrane biosynthesis protein TonB
MPAPRKYRRPRGSLSTLRDEPTPPNWWLIALVLFSLLAHILVMLAFILIGRHTPKWKELAASAPPPEVSLTLQPPPPAQPQRPEFIPTEPDANAVAPNSPLISDHNSVLRSHNRKSRTPDVPLPDVSGRHRTSDLREKPPSVASKPQTATPPTPQSQRQPPEPHPVKPNQAVKPTPPQPHPDKNPEKKPDKGTAQKPAPTETVDANGLPVLPPIEAPTLAQQTPQTQPVQHTPHRASPASIPSFAVYQSEVSGQSGQPGDNSPAARATELGRYKARVYSAVGSRWYAKVSNQLQLLGVGTVHVTYTIHSDGSLEITVDPDAGNPALMLLHSISINSMTEAAPFPPFSDAMKKEVGDSFTDDFSFSIYGN